MPRTSSGGIRLPKQLLDQLDIDVSPSHHKGVLRPTFRNRKAKRRAARVEKKTSRAQIPRISREIPRSQTEPSNHATSHYPNKKPVSQRRTEESPVIEDVTTEFHGQDFSDGDDVDPQHLRKIKITGRTKRNLEEDDATIAALERKLGIKGKQKLPKAFADDGLLDLLEGVTGDRIFEETDGNASDFWLHSKRLKSSSDQCADSQSESEFSGFVESETHHEPSPSLGDRNLQASSGAKINVDRSQKTNVLRKDPGSNVVNLPQRDARQHLRRSVRGIFNRLSEPNLLILLTEVEETLGENSRKSVFDVFLDSVLDQVGGPDPLSDTFLILHAGFVAAAFKILGFDFGTEAIKRITQSLDDALKCREFDAENQKRAMNLVTVLTHLFTLGMISSELIYDFIRIFVDTISEDNTLLLLRVIKASGAQLRQQDPSSLKDIVTHLQSALAHQNPEDISVRTRFMIETITDLKNNKVRGGVNASSIAIEHLMRMQKTLSAIDQTRVKAMEPLRISLKDFHDDAKSGPWWQAGAEFRLEQDDGERLVLQTSTHEKDLSLLGDVKSIQMLASEQRMNTDVRRSIFTNIMSASDCQDAFQRLVGLRLRNSQESEIANVLLYCATAEDHYNPYYSLVAGLLCSSRRFKISLQVALWDTLKRIQADTFTSSTDIQPPELLRMRPVIHLARLFGELLGTRKLDINLIKNCSIAGTSGTTLVFLEMLFLTVFRYVRRKNDKGALEQNLSDIFEPLSTDAAKSMEVRTFLQGIVRNSDMVASSKEYKRLCCYCDIIDKVLYQE